MRRASASEGTVPTQLQIVIETAADGVHVGIVEAGDDGAPAHIDDLGGVIPERHDLLVAPDGDEATLPDGHGGGKGTAFVLRGNAATILVIFFVTYLAK
jgi:hypothetical protein